MSHVWSTGDGEAAHQGHTDHSWDVGWMVVEDGRRVVGGWRVVE